MPRSKHRRKPARGKQPKSSLYHSASHSASEERKMSEVLLEFIKPYRELAQSDADLQKLIGLGIVAWNVSLLPITEREGALNDLVTDLFRSKSPIKRLSRLIRKWLGVEEKADKKAASAEITEFKQIVYEMVEHKLRRFARNRRFIVSYHMEIEDDDMQLFVASTLDGLEATRGRV
jgi:transposase